MNLKIESKRNFNETLERLQLKVTENGFRVLHIHNVKQTLKEKGFEIDDYSIVEVCNAKFANSVLGINKEYGTLMPCKIIVYTEDEKSYILLPLPTQMVKGLKMESIIEFASEIERILINIINQTTEI